MAIAHLCSPLDGHIGFCSQHGCNGGLCATSFSGCWVYLEDEFIRVQLLGCTFELWQILSQPPHFKDSFRNPVRVQSPQHRCLRLPSPAATSLSGVSGTLKCFTGTCRHSHITPKLSLNSQRERVLLVCSCSCCRFTLSHWITTFISLWETLTCYIFHQIKYLIQPGDSDPGWELQAQRINSVNPAWGRG